MNISVQSSKAVKPAAANAGDSGASSEATDIVVLTALDKVNFDQYISSLYFFLPQAAAAAAAAPNALLEQGLSKALAVHRHWAGRFGAEPNGGDRAILLNDAGVRFVQATSDAALSSSCSIIMPGGGVELTPELLSLHPSGDGADELMLVQVTRFACGSVVVGTTAHHLVADAYGRCAFMTAWGNATRGVAVDPVPAAVHDRKSVFAPRSPPRIEFEHRGVEFVRRPRRAAADMEILDSGDNNKAVVHRVHFSAEMVSKLRSQASSAGGGAHRHSAVKCVAAHLWRCITAARGLAGETATALKLAVNGRRRMRCRPEVPEGVRRQRRAVGAPGRHRGGARGDDAAGRHGGAHLRGGGAGRRRLLQVVDRFRELRGGGGVGSGAGGGPGEDGALPGRRGVQPGGDPGVRRGLWCWPAVPVHARLPSGGGARVHGAVVVG